MKALKIICLTVAVTLMLTGCGSSAINAPAPLSSQTPIMKATQGSASEDKDNDSPELSKGIPLVDACISKLEANKIDGGNDGMLILKRLSYCLNQLSNGKAFTTLKERSYSPIYDFGSFANMMDEDMLWKITNNTLSGEDPYKGVTGFIERAYVSETDQSLDSYVAYVPSGYVSNRSYPLIVLLHGYGGGAYLPPDSPAHAAFLKICEKYNVIMVAPNGKNKIPNVSVYHDDGEKDVLQVIKLAEKAYNIDTKRVYLTGMSMGGHGTW
ncbi:MAG: hypothetical protein N2376_12210, partial [Clostridia bacterium]|nr:hypothetical protein [Clostridia bacterium]